MALRKYEKRMDDTLRGLLRAVCQEKDEAQRSVALLVVADRLGELGEDDVHLDVCSDWATTIARVQSEAAGLVLAHPRGPEDDAPLNRLLSAVAAADLPVPVVVLADKFDEQRAAALRRAGAADYLEPPLDLGKLGLSFRRKSRPGPRGPSLWERPGNQRSARPRRLPRRRPAPRRALPCSRILSPGAPDSCPPNVLPFRNR
jgi:hypothetical protein